VKVGISVPSINPLASPGFLERFARHAEDSGFESLWVGEHVVLFDEYDSPYPYSEDGKLFITGEVGMLEPFSTLCFLAACTTRIRLGTGVCLVPHRNPVYTAKNVATLDWLSNGRFDFGIGLGWSREEFEVVEVPWEHRGARCDDYIEAMRRLWSEPVSSYDGAHYGFGLCRMFPKPVQRPHPPIHIGGESDAALRRVVMLGNGWHGFNLAPTQAAERVTTLEDMLDARGRARDDIEVTIGTYLLPVDRRILGEYADAGVDRIVVMALAANEDDVLEGATLLARELID
jgi:probable F420-dependent oxidoreductase